MTRIAIHLIGSFLIAFTMIWATQMSFRDEALADHWLGLDAAPILIEGLHPALAGSANYTTCTDDPAYVAFWRYGPDTWQRYMLSAFTLSHLSNCNTSSTTRVVMMWEYPGVAECQSAVYVACFGANPSGHYTHSGHDHLTQSYILFDSALYSPLAYDWKSRISAHEWGHPFTLQDHNPGVSPCTIDSRIMEFGSTAGAACILNPSQSEICSVWTAYNYQRFTDGDPQADGCDSDADNDHCLNAFEIANQGIKEPDNPLDRRDFPDFDADGKVDFDDFEFFASVLFTNNPIADLDGDGYVDFDDFEIFVAAWLRTCP